MSAQGERSGRGKRQVGHGGGYSVALGVRLEVGTQDIGLGYQCSPGPERTQPGLNGT